MAADYLTVYHFWLNALLLWIFHSSFVPVLCRLHWNLSQLRFVHDSLSKISWQLMPAPYIYFSYLLPDWIQERWLMNPWFPNEIFEVIHSFIRKDWWNILIKCIERVNKDLSLSKLIIINAFWLRTLCTIKEPRGVRSMNFSFNRTYRLVQSYGVFQCQYWLSYLSFVK